MTDADSLVADSTLQPAVAYDVPADRPVSEGVVAAVAAAAGADPVATGADERTLAPLYDAVDPDALDALFRHTPEGAAGRVTFTYEGFEVTVHDDGFVTVA